MLLALLMVHHLNVVKDINLCFLVVHVKEFLVKAVDKVDIHLISNLISLVIPFANA